MEAFAVIRAEEKRVFKEKSFYYHKERFLQYSIPMPTVEPDLDVLEDEILAAAGQEGLLFAEEAEE